MTRTKYACSQTSLYAIGIRACQICLDAQATFFAFDTQTFVNIIVTKGVTKRLNVEMVASS